MARVLWRCLADNNELLPHIDVSLKPEAYTGNIYNVLMVKDCSTFVHGTLSYIFHCRCHIMKHSLSGEHSVDSKMQSSKSVSTCRSLRLQSREKLVDYSLL